MNHGWNQGPQWRVSSRHPGRMTLLSILLLLIAFPWTAQAEDYDRWYTIEMSGGRAGWMHSVQTTSGDRITTRNELRFAIGRADLKVTIGMEGQFVETKDGKPVSMKTVMTLGQAPTTMECTYGQTEMHITTAQSGQRKELTRPLPEGKWLTPAASMDFLRQRFAAKAETIEIRTIEIAGGMDPLSALNPVTITHKDCRPTTIEAMGKKIEAIRCISTTSTQAGIESVEVIDAQGIPIRSETNLGGMAMVAMAATEAEAKADKPGPELMTSTFVKPDRAIPNARASSHAVYTVSVGSGKLPEFPSTGTQRVEMLSDHSARLTIATREPAAAPEADSKDKNFTAASATIDSDDPQIRRLSAEATRDAGPSKAERAEAMRRFVHSFIRSKDLTVGFASATEVARSRQGDCSEHGVLLAAILRADGIPSRVVCGLIYAEGFAGSRDIFGYHMWAQALLDVEGKPTWVDLDATLPDATPYDATHIALAVSALADGQTQDALVSLATVIGRLKIQVESVK